MSQNVQDSLTYYLTIQMASIYMCIYIYVYICMYIHVCVCGGGGGGQVLCTRMEVVDD